MIFESVNFKLIVIENYSFLKRSGFLQYSRGVCYVVFVFLIINVIQHHIFVLLCTVSLFYFKSFSECVVSSGECL